MAHPPRPIRARILLAAGWQEARQMIASELRRDGHEVVEFGDGATLLAQLRFDVVTQRRGTDRCLVIAGQGGGSRRAATPAETRAPAGPARLPRGNSGGPCSPGRSSAS